MTSELLCEPLGTIPSEPAGTPPLYSGSDSVTRCIPKRLTHLRRMALRSGSLGDLFKKPCARSW